MPVRLRRPRWDRHRLRGRRRQTGLASRPFRGARRRSLERHHWISSAGFCKRQISKRVVAAKAERKMPDAVAASDQEGKAKTRPREITRRGPCCRFSLRRGDLRIVSSPLRPRVIVVRGQPQGFLRRSDEPHCSAVPGNHPGRNERYLLTDRPLDKSGLLSPSVVEPFAVFQLSSE